MAAVPSVVGGHRARLHRGVRRGGRRYFLCRHGQRLVPERPALVWGRIRDEAVALTPFVVLGQVLGDR